MQYVQVQDILTCRVTFSSVLASMSFCKRTKFKVPCDEEVALCQLGVVLCLVDNYWSFSGVFCSQSTEKYENINR